MGNKRRLGIELEFHGLSPSQTADIICQVLNGTIEKVSEDEININTSLGCFRAETDASIIKKLSKASEQNTTKDQPDFDGWIKGILEVVSKKFVPTELVCPPIPTSKISIIVSLQRALADEGAEGSIDSVRFAFGAQLNPELLELTSERILSDFQSFLIMSDWLKRQILIDPTRTMTLFAADFPKAYQMRVLQPDYQPDMDKLIDDYLEHNPTRNRGLDLLPLLMHIDRQRVKSVVTDELVKSRPAFHYRLPNCQISLPSWNIEIEWQRWLLVEKLARSSLFEDVRNHYLQYLEGHLDTTSHRIAMNNYVERLRIC